MLEDVVDEQEHVLALAVAEVLGDGQRAERHACACARGLVHLAVHERGLGEDALAGGELGLLHLVVQVVAFARTLTHAREAGYAAMRLRDVVDELHDEHRLAHAGAAEQADLAALAVGREQVDDLDAGLEDLDLRALLDEGGSRFVNRVVLLGDDLGPRVHGLADHIQDASQRLIADRHRDGGACVLHGHTAHQTVGRVHRDRAHGAFTEVLRDLEHQVVLDRVDRRVGYAQRAEQLGQLAGRELHVHDRADDLRNGSTD
jgi:hypothetical protein